MLDGTPGMLGTETGGGALGAGVGSATAAAPRLKDRTAAATPTSRAFMAKERIAPPGRSDPQDAGSAAGPGRPAAAPARPAASVLLLRAAELDPFEVFMVRRAAGGKWPHLYVFPGGRLDETDGGSFAAAGARELFEETGVRVQSEALVPFSHWITPQSEPHRFDTHFFLAHAPADQDARADEIETHDGQWLAPRAALLRFGEGRLPMIYPTIKHLERLLLFRDLDELFAFARTKTILTVMPKTFDENDVFSMSRELEHRW
jgi:8-oxo-dGTP pyrophosphatase MutT (NUDIX family)